MGYEFEEHNSEYILGNVRLLRHNPEPCIVCGHPTGDCSGAEHTGPDHIWGLTEVESMQNENMMLLEHDVIEWRQITPFTKSKVIVARAGQQISVAQAKLYGII